MERFSLIPKSQIHCVLEHRRIPRLAATGAWAKRWANWSVLRELVTDLPRNDMDIKFAPMGEEVVLGRKVVNITNWLGENPRDDLVQVHFCAFRYA